MAAQKLSGDPVGHGQKPEPRRLVVAQVHLQQFRSPGERQLQGDGLVEGGGGGEDERNGFSSFQSENSV